MTTAVVICPGRGTYGPSELGVLAHFPDRALLAGWDALRAGQGQQTLSDLDGAARYSLALHSRGDTASALIYAASFGDWLALSGVDVVAVTGNSMGWYSALACGGAVSPDDGFRLVNTMGTLMQDALIGGQLVYPVVDDDWRPDPARRAALLEGLPAGVHLSIDLGGLLVLAGQDDALTAFEASVPALDRFPMRLTNHAAFHTSLMAPIAAQGRAALPASMVQDPALPLIDGRGAIWWPGASDRAALWDYTLGHQVTEPYDFAAAIRTAAQEFAPDLFIVLGPGTTLGGAVAQSLIQAGWRGMTDKAAFQAEQDRSGLLVSMGRADQRTTVVQS